MNFFDIMEWQLIPKPDFHDIDKVRQEVEGRKRKLKQKAVGSKKTKNEELIKNLTKFMQDISLDKLESVYQEVLDDAKKAIAEELSIVAATGELSATQAKRMAKKYNVPSDFLYENFNLVQPQEKQLRKLETPKCTNKMSSQIQDKLLLLGKKDLYDYLCHENSLEDRKKVRLMASGQLLERAKVLYGKFDRDTDLDRKTAGQNLSTLCQELFQNDASKRDYDYYLDTYYPVNEILKKVISVAEGEEKAKILQPQVGEALVAEINSIIRNTEESRAYLRGKCQEQNITWIEVADSGIANCVFCGKRIGVGDEVCGHCGKKQYLECPKCKKKVLANVVFCTSCGSKFGSAVKTAEYCDAALLEIQKLNFAAARTYLDLAKKEGVIITDFAAVEKKLHQEEENIGESVHLMEKCQKEGLYYKANQILKDIKAKYPNYKNDSFEAICSDAISRAKKLFDKAVAAEREKKCLEYCTQIEQICKDYPGVCQLKEKFPPDIPTDVQVKPDNRNKANTVFWRYSGLMLGVEFIVLRKEDVKPENVKDGEFIGRFSSLSCIDKTPEAGRNYYYAVFACRGNKISNPGVAVSSVINIYDVENVSVVSGDNIVKLSWKPIKEGVVRVWRKDNGTFPQKSGDGIELTNVSQNGVWDHSVRNGGVYGYIVCVEYMADCGNMYSTGVKVRGIPEVPPQAVTYLLSEQDEKNNQIFLLEWDSDITGKVKFYGSPKELKWDEGSLVAKEDIEKIATELNISVKEAGKGILNIGNGGEMYVTAVTMGKESGIIGAGLFLSNQQIFKITDTKLVHGDIDISISSWPDGCSALKVLYRKDQYPKGYTDKESESFICTRAMYKESNSIVLKRAAKENYYISIYGIYNGSKGYSPAVRVKYVNQEKQRLCYDLKVRKGILGKIAGVTLIISGENPISIPELVVIRNRGYLPPNILAGERVLMISAEKEKRKRFEFPLGSGFEKNDYIRLFLSDSKDSSLYELDAVGDLNI